MDNHAIQSLSLIGKLEIKGIFPNIECFKFNKKLLAQYFASYGLL